MPLLTELAQQASQHSVERAVEQRFPSHLVFQLPLNPQELVLVGQLAVAQARLEQDLSTLLQQAWELLLSLEPLEPC
jgi:hypothetical protein